MFGNNIEDFYADSDGSDQGNEDNDEDEVESWDHEVATCDKSCEDFWDGDWEPCRLLNWDGCKYVTVEREDGSIVQNVLSHLVRLRKD